MFISKLELEQLHEKIFTQYLAIRELQARIGNLEAAVKGLEVGFKDETTNKT